MNTSSEQSSAEIQREIDADRARIEARIGAIQERMSPGQLVDEVINYAKGSGGAEYVSNLGKSLKANPLPVALMGVSLAWLMAKQGSSAPEQTASLRRDDYPLYTAQGAIRRIGPPEEASGSRYSHFTDDAGKRFKALTDKAGHRAGHFMDESGKTYRGFADATGNHISRITDEAGSLLDASTGWASETWQQVKDIAGGVSDKVSDRASSMSSSASSAGSKLKDQSSRLNQAILTQFRDQPLVGGALAFAIGAAIGAALPHTETEDELVGATADDVKANAKAQASDLVEQGKGVASDALDKAATVVADVHDATKDRIAEEVGQIKDRGSLS